LLLFDSSFNFSFFEFVLDDCFSSLFDEDSSFFEFDSFLVAVTLCDGTGRNSSAFSGLKNIY
jgi:hypothetical protein